MLAPPEGIITPRSLLDLCDDLIPNDEIEWVTL